MDWNLCVFGIICNKQMIYLNLKHYIYLSYGCNVLQPLAGFFNFPGFLHTKWKFPVKLFKFATYIYLFLERIKYYFNSYYRTSVNDISMMNISKGQVFPAGYPYCKLYYTWFVFLQLNFLSVFLNFLHTLWCVGGVNEAWK